MKSAEKISAPESVEVKHFDDFEAMDVALRGLKRVLADRPKPATVAGEESQATDDGEIEPAEETDEYWEDDYGDYDSYDDDYEYEYDAGEERLEELEREKQFEVLTIPKEILEEYKLPEDLPAGVAVMGGTARSLARRVVTGDKEPVRDLDLIYIEELSEPDNPVSQETLEEISEKYMPDDFAYGHGIKHENLEHYFASRDFTMNQCLVVGNKLLMTRAAYDDFQENIIRPSYDRKPREYSPLSDSDFMRGLLFLTVLKDCTGSYPMAEDLMSGRYDEYDEPFGVGEFQIALALNKAMSRGVRTAMHFTETLADYDLIDEKYIDEPLRLARAIIDSGDVRFRFRPVDTEIEDGDDEDEDFDTRATSPMKGKVRKTLREYESRDRKRWTEPLSGKYTKADYDKANGAA